MTNRKVIRIEGNGLPRTTKIFLSDIDVSRYVTGIHISMGAKSAPSVVLYCVGEVELPDELEALVYVDKPKKKRQWGELEKGTLGGNS